MAIDPTTSVYGTNNSEQFAAVVDVDINAPNVNWPERTSAKAKVVYPVGGGSSGEVVTEWSTGNAEQIGATDEAAPGTDTATSGLNGRLQRIAQRLTSLITLLGLPVPVFLRRPGWMYTYNVLGYTAYATPTDMFTLTAPVDKRIIVQLFGANVAQTTASIQVGYIEIRATTSTGGTATTPTPQKLDSTAPAAGGVIRVYSAAPAALGAVLNTVAIIRASIPAATGAASGWSTGTFFSSVGFVAIQDVMVLNPGECMAFNFAGAPLPAGFTAQLTLCWTEEDV